MGETYPGELICRQRHDAVLASMIKSFLLAPIFVVLMSGCTGVTYSPYTESPAQTTVFSENVFYELKDIFYQRVPDCVTILPTKLIRSHQTNMYIERSAARHFSEKVGRVIGPFQRAHLERGLGLDLSQQQDRKTFLQQTRCTHFLQPTLAELHEGFSVVWSNKAIDLELTLHGVAEDDVCGGRVTRILEALVACLVPTVSRFSRIQSRSGT